MNAGLVRGDSILLSQTFRCPDKKSTTAAQVKVIPSPARGFAALTLPAWSCRDRFSGDRRECLRRRFPTGMISKATLVSVRIGNKRVEIKPTLSGQDNKKDPCRPSWA